MYYFLIVQVLCGFFSAFVAARKGREPVRWWFVGALLPVVGVVLSLKAEEANADEPVTLGAPASPAKSKGRVRPSRCCRSYIPDCLGCPYFRRRLFSGEQRDGLKGRCQYFDIDLVEEPSRNRRHATARKD